MSTTKSSKAIHSIIFAYLYLSPGVSNKPGHSIAWFIGHGVARRVFLKPKALDPIPLDPPSRKGDE
jgi:hypothetical protein